MPSTELTNLTQIQDYLERRVKVLYAGVVAQALYDDAVNNDEALKAIQVGGINDDAKVRELIHLLRNIRFPSTTLEVESQKELTGIDTELWNDTIYLVETESSVIREVAGALLEKIVIVNQQYVMTEAEIDAIPIIQTRFSVKEKDEPSK